MSRRVFFSFHYDDVANFRANVVRQSNAVLGRDQLGFFDASVWETAKRTSELAIKRLIDQALENTSVTCVLIGSETYNRHWVRYEILKSIERGNGLLGVHINGIRDKYRQTTVNGPNPFDFLRICPLVSYQANPHIAMERDGFQWRKWDGFNFYPERPIDIQLSSLYPVYDWIANDGINNFAVWIENAARVAGR